MEVDTEELLQSLQSMDNAAEMMEEVNRVCTLNPLLFPPEFLEKLRENIEIGRIYGKRVGAKNLLKQLEQFFSDQTE